MKAWEVPMKGTTNKLWNESRTSIQSQDMWYERNSSDPWFGTKGEHPNHLSYIHMTIICPYIYQCSYNRN